MFGIFGIRIFFLDCFIIIFLSVCFLINVICGVSYWLEFFLFLKVFGMMFDSKYLLRIIWVLKNYFRDCRNCKGNIFVFVEVSCYFLVFFLFKV